MAERSVRLRRPESYRDTQVPVHRSIANIEAILGQFGAEATAVSIVRRGEDAFAEVTFAYEGRVYRMRLRLGDAPQDHRQRLRVLFWYIKATCEAVMFEVVAADEALLPYLEIADGQGGRTTVGAALLSRGAELPRALPEEIFRAVGMRALPAPQGGR